MDAATRSALDDYYAHVFGLDPAALWQEATARVHTGRLEGYEGYYVAWRGDGVHVSAPLSGDGAALDALATEPVGSLQAVDRWRAFAERRGLHVIGPSTHAYLDRDPGPVDDVVRVRDDDLRSLRDAVGEDDWTESGWHDQPQHAFGLYEDDRLVAAANLNPFHGEPRDVGVVVMPASRGRGLSVKVGQHAAAFAIREHGFARWGARNSNAASLAASRRLGFEPWCTQLAIR